MRVLVACEFSCQVRNAFLAKGHDAYSCDLLQCFGPPFERHYRQDVRPLLKQKWDLVIAHPPCTYLTIAAHFLLKKEPGRWVKMLAACEFFHECLSANSPRICIENPVQHKDARQRIPIYSQIIHPWQFGHRTTKPTCLWLRGVPKLLATDLVTPPYANLLRNKGGRFRAQVRSITFPNIAKAMAEQWG